MTIPSCFASIPPRVATQVWRADALGSMAEPCMPTGFNQLDAELPGGGWPLGAVTELLHPQFSTTEWRLLLPAIACRASTPKPVLAIGPYHRPYFGGLRLYGLGEESLVLVQARTPGERLWAAEQAVRANGLAAVIAWLPHARAEQIRRLQACAAASEFPTFLVRPEATQHESSPAPLRLIVRDDGLDAIAVHVFKRRGARHEGWIRLPAAIPAMKDVARPTSTSPKRIHEPRPGALDRAARTVTARVAERSAA